MDRHDLEPFKARFKYYKRRNPPPDFSTVLNFHALRDVQEQRAKGIEKIELHKTTTAAGGFTKDPTQWEAFTVHSHPGFIFIKNPFTQQGQEYWIDQCLDRYPRKPNPSNLDSLMPVDQTWPWSEDGYRKPQDSCKVLERLRWVTLGHHHNWDTKEYDEHFKGDFPSDLAQLSAHVGRSIGVENYTAEAAIVNYYSMDSCINGHTDHSERNLDAPLISFSFGQSAVFLLGGLTKSVEPLAVLIKSGDIVIMAGESRLSYHAVPRIVHDPDFSCPGKWSEQMKVTRLNMNVRQVNHL